MHTSSSSHTILYALLNMQINRCGAAAIFPAIIQNSPNYSNGLSEFAATLSRRILSNNAVWRGLSDNI